MKEKCLYELALESAKSNLGHHGIDYTGFSDESILEIARRNSSRCLHAFTRISPTTRKCSLCGSLQTN